MPYSKNAKLPCRQMSRIGRCSHGIMCDVTQIRKRSKGDVIGHSAQSEKEIMICKAALPRDDLLSF